MKKPSLEDVLRLTGEPFAWARNLSRKDSCEDNGIDLMTIWKIFSDDTALYTEAQTNIVSTDALMDAVRKYGSSKTNSEILELIYSTTTNTEGEQG